MKKIVLTTAAVTLGFMLAAAGSANAEGRSMKSARPAPAAIGLKIGASPVGAANVPDNTAHEWTAGCYAEFGPDAKYPDAELLEKCLN
ncbi:hypothetical protein LL06_14625 [Hoeflea sp. BAL378]|uniref:hypothetical protein n=1 Tax=Hoeflea sp. BAL378 TaxID=1547437 RepID=UPI0005130D0F|nr:hypothetical protein [Hoeflea sp. BAL378]KGF68762.1 hypothetical protein LL06_14625 [Hoeflea sp. BAL378]